MTGIALTVAQGESEPCRLVFGQSPIQIGRSSSAEVCLPSAAVSAMHAEVSRHGRDWVLSDLGSTNGTRLNGTSVGERSPRLIRSGDRIQVAGFTIGVETDVPFDATIANTTAMLGRGFVREVLSRLQPEQAAPRLVVVAGPDRGLDFTFSDVGARARIGRAQDCELRLRDALVSRAHATIRRDMGGLVVWDLESSNSTVIGDRAVAEQTRLRDREVIKLGNTEIAVSDPSDEILCEMELLPDEAWRDEPEPPSGGRGDEPNPPSPSVLDAPAKSEPRGRARWEWVLIAFAIVAMGGAAVLLYVLFGDG